MQLNFSKLQILMLLMLAQSSVPLCATAADDYYYHFCPTRFLPDVAERGLLPGVVTGNGTCSAIFFSHNPPSHLGDGYTLFGVPRTYVNSMPNSSTQVGSSGLNQVVAPANGRPANVPPGQIVVFDKPPQYGGTHRPLVPRAAPQGCLRMTPQAASFLGNDLPMGVGGVGVGAYHISEGIDNFSTDPLAGGVGIGLGSAAVLVSSGQLIAGAGGVMGSAAVADAGLAIGGAGVVVAEATGVAVLAAGSAAAGYTTGRLLDAATGNSISSGGAVVLSGFGDLLTGKWRFETTKTAIEDFGRRDKKFHW